MAVYPTAFVTIDLLVEDFGQERQQVRLEGSPIEIQVEKNPYNEADTFEIKVDFEDFPLDPRILKAGTVEVFVADAAALDPDFWARQSPADLRRLCLVAGVIDDIEGGLDDQWRSTRLKGRDYTAYLLDAEAKVFLPETAAADGKLERVLVLSPKKALSAYVREILDAKDETKAIRIRSPEGTPDPVPYTYKAEKRRKVKDGETIWDLLQELAFDAGLLLYVEKDELVIREPREMLAGAERPDDTWTWTLGADVKAFRPRRRLARQQGVNVRVVSYAPDEPKKKLAAIWPKNPLRSSKPVLGAAAIGDTNRPATTTPEVTFTTFVVRGITDDDQLEEIAKQIHEQLRHHEFEGTIETAAMLDSRGRDVVEMRYGDPVVLDVQETLRSFVALTPQAQIRRLTGIGYDTKDARVIAQALTLLSVPFYLHRAIYTLSTRSEEGFQLEIEVRARKQVDLPES